MSWVSYRRKRGCLNLGMRVERGAALVAALYVNSKLGKNTTPYELHDFAPHHDKPEITIEEAMSRWG